MTDEDAEAVVMQGEVVGVDLGIH
uniref:Uncharacterized protein n=1 Tax=Anguilla anguilla TaxID=7936 RepID=A0A0E9QP06_ANGAN